MASKYLILYGKRRFVFMILLGATGAFALSYLLPMWFAATLELKVIGWVIPGLLASSLEKQGWKITGASLAIMLVVLYGVGKLFFLLF
jgi:hypothetical protein